MYVVVQGQTYDKIIMVFVCNDMYSLYLLCMAVCMHVCGAKFATDQKVEVVTE